MRHTHAGTIRRPSLHRALPGKLSRLPSRRKQLLPALPLRAAQMAAYSFAVFDEHGGDENGLGNRWPSEGPVVWNGSPGFCGEAVQVQTVIPVSTADQRQFVRSEMVYGKVEGTFQVLHQRLSLGRNRCRNQPAHRRDGEISGLFDVGGRIRRSARAGHR